MFLKKSPIVTSNFVFYQIQLKYFWCQRQASSIIVSSLYRLGCHPSSFFAFLESLTNWDGSPARRGPSDTFISSKSACIFDKNAIRIEPSVNDIFTVVSKEYRINHYVYTVISDSLKLKSEMKLDTSLSIGDKCNVQPIHEKNFLVLPENIKCKF